jgi:hypothetical protein
MPWLHHLAFPLFFAIALFWPAVAGAFVSSTPANAHIRFAAFSFIATTPNQTAAALPQVRTQGGIPRGADVAAAGLIPGVPVGPTLVCTGSRLMGTYHD